MAGVQRTALPRSPAELAEQSAKALDAAMNTIHAMAKRVITTIDALTERPSKIEVDFALTLDATAGALIAAARTEASFEVKLTWERELSAKQQTK